MRRRRGDGREGNILDLVRVYAYASMHACTDVCECVIVCGGRLEGRECACVVCVGVFAPSASDLGMTSIVSGYVCTKCCATSFLCLAMIIRMSICASICFVFVRTVLR